MGPPGGWLNERPRTARVSVQGPAKADSSFLLSKERLSATSLILPGDIGLRWGSQGGCKLDPSDKVNMMYSHFLQVNSHIQEAAVVVFPPENSIHFEVQNAMNIHHGVFLFD